MEVDDNLKKLIQNLGVAINHALSHSPEISGAIENVREAGYDVFLVLEATIGFNSKASTAHTTESPQSGDGVTLKVNAQDMKFLKSLKIKVDDLNAP